MDSIGSDLAQAYDDGYKDGLRDNATSVTEKIETLKAEHDRFKARAEAAERDIRALSDEFKLCRFCKHDRGGGIWDCQDYQCNAKNHYEWRGPQEGANT